MASIPFRGSPNREDWTLGVKPDSFFNVTKLDKEVGQRYLPEPVESWQYYEWSDQMGLRPNYGVSIPSWASMGYWKKNQFGLLFALSARVPDFAIVAFVKEIPAKVSCALVCQVEDRIFVAVGSGPRKTKAKQDVAEKLIVKALLWDWLSVKHGNTKCEDYLLDYYCQTTPHIPLSPVRFTKMPGRNRTVFLSPL